MFSPGQYQRVSLAKHRGRFLVTKIKQILGKPSFFVAAPVSFHSQSRKPSPLIPTWTIPAWRRTWLALGLLGLLGRLGSLGPNLAPRRPWLRPPPQDPRFLGTFFFLGISARILSVIWNRLDGFPSLRWFSFRPMLVDDEILSAVHWCEQSHLSVLPFYPYSFSLRSFLAEEMPVIAQSRLFALPHC